MSYCSCLEGTSGQVLRKMNTESHMFSPNFILQLFLSVCICLCINACAQAQKGMYGKLEDWVFSSDYVSSGTGKVITLTSKWFCSCSDNRWLGTLGVLEWVMKRSVATYVKSMAYSVMVHYLYAGLIIYVSETGGGLQMGATVLRYSNFLFKVKIVFANNLFTFSYVF